MFESGVAAGSGGRGGDGESDYDYYQQHHHHHHYDDDDEDDKEKSSHYYSHRKNISSSKKENCRSSSMKHFNRFTSEFYNTSVSNRKLLIGIMLLILFVLFVHNSSTPSADVELILDVNKMRLEKVDRRQAIIMDTLRNKRPPAQSQHQQHQGDAAAAGGGIVEPIDNGASFNNEDEAGIPAFRLITEFKNGIYFYNIHEPTESWWPFECLPTRMKQSLNTMVCIHEPKFDKHISQQLKENGLWEPTNVRSFLAQLRDLNDTHVIDIGANIGVYTLLAAKLGRHVIAVEPLHENLNRMHKAAHLEGVQSKIIALVNAIANERTQLKLSIMDYNIGGTYVLQPDLVDPEQKFYPTSSSVLVNSMLMDDLVDVAEARLNASLLTRPRKFIVKIDIEGYEPYAFERAGRLFDTYQVPAVFMEFGKTVQKLAAAQKGANSAPSSSYETKIRNMLEFFKRRNYEPYEVNGLNKLDYAKWQFEWPWDVYFKKCDLIFCPNHVYKLGEKSLV